MKKNLYYIDLSQNYLRTLAKGLVEQFGVKNLPYLTILLPSQRAILEFQTIFSKIFQNSIIPKSINFKAYCTSLLNEVRPDIEFHTFSNFDRHFFVIECLKKIFPKQKLHHLNELASTITSTWDEITLSGTSKSQVIHCLEKNISTSYFSSIFLDITKMFHHFLKNQSLFDEKESLYSTLDAASTIIYENQNLITNPIILGGTTGTIPAVRQLADALLLNEKGFVVLPGLPDFFSNLSPYHPFYTQNEWMKEYNGNVIKPFFKNIDSSYNIAKIFLNNPPEEIRETDKYLFFETSSLYQESLLIAFLVRHHLHIEPEKDITIVCGNQYLIQLIQEQLYQFDFFANNSLSASLLNTMAGSFLQALLNFNLKFSLKNMITLLKHPFYQKEDHFEHLKILENFESTILQDDKYTRENLLCLFPILKNSHEKLKQCHSFLNWVDNLEEELTIISNNFIFQDEEGQTFRKFFDTIKMMPLKTSDPADWIEWIFSSLKLHTIQVNHKQLHQKVRLIGTLESRHNSSEIVIIAGLNEGTWPPTPEANFWLNPHLEKEFHLPEMTRRLSLNAHDFANCLSAERVYLTRSLKVDGKIQEKSRLLNRLELHIKPSKNLIHFKGWIESILQQKTSKDLIVADKSIKLFPSNIPKPSKISISALELLNKDPESYYVRYILNARERPEWYKGLSAAHIGQIAHKILEEINFKTANIESIKKDIAKLFFKLELSFHEKIFLTDHLLNMINFAAMNTRNYKYIKQLREKKLSLQLDNIEIYGIADRIDFLQESIHLIDYKTGIAPTFKSICKKQSLQMPLLVEMILKNYNKSVQASYWKLSGVKGKSQIITLPLTPQICEDHMAHIKTLLKNAPWSVKI